MPSYSATVQFKTSRAQLTLTPTIEANTHEEAFALAKAQHQRSALGRLSGPDAPDCILVIGPPPVGVRMFGDMARCFDYETGEEFRLGSRQGRC